MSKSNAKGASAGATASVPADALAEAKAEEARAEWGKAEKIGAEAIEVLGSDSNLIDQGKEIAKLMAEINLGLLKPILGEKLEAQALSRYKDNEEWALKAVLQDSREAATDDEWAGMQEKMRAQLRAILTPEQIAKGFPVEELVDALPSVVEEYVLNAVRGWQRETFDPIEAYMDYLGDQGASQDTKRTRRTVVARFIGMHGRKAKYSDIEVQVFMRSERKRLNDRSYCTRYAEIKSFLASLDQNMNMQKPKMPKGAANAPVLTKSEIESLIVGAWLAEEPLDVLARLVLATIYGCRAGEVAAFSASDVDLDRSTICIATAKGGEIKPQVLPEGLEVFFGNGLAPVSEDKVYRMMRRVLRSAGIKRRAGLGGSSATTGCHSIRRGVATALDEAGVDALSIFEWQRWSTERRFGMLPTYIKRRPGDSDMRVLDKHPFLPLWLDVAQAVRDREESAYLDYCFNLVLIRYSAKY